MYILKKKNRNGCHGCNTYQSTSKRRLEFTPSITKIDESYPIGLGFIVSVNHGQHIIYFNNELVKKSFNELFDAKVADLPDVCCDWCV